VNKKARFVTNLVFFIAKLRIICAFIHIFCIEKVGQKCFILELSFSIFPELAGFELKQPLF